MRVYLTVILIYVSPLVSVASEVPSFCSRLFSVFKPQTVQGSLRWEKLLQEPVAPYSYWINSKLPDRSNSVRLAMVPSRDPSSFYFIIAGYKDASEVINAPLRQNFQGVSVWEKGSLKKHAQDLVETLRLNPVENGLVYRGGYVSEQENKLILSALNLEKTISFPSFFSTSKKSAIAKKFLTEAQSLWTKKEGDRDALLPAYFIVESKNGRAVDTGITRFNGEQEVIFPPNTKFFVTGVSEHLEKDGLPPTKIIHLREALAETVHFRKWKTDNYKFENLDDHAFAQIPGLSNEPQAKQWKTAYLSLLNKLKDREINLATLTDLHAQGMKDHLFSEHEIRRIRDAYQKKQISKLDALNALDSIDRGTPLSQPVTNNAGVLRSNPIDDLTFNGYLSDQTGVLKLSEKELEGAVSNPYLFYDHYLSATPDGWTPPPFYHVSSVNVSRVMEDTLKLAQTKLAEAQSDEEYVRITAVLYRTLVSIQPFLEGNEAMAFFFSNFVLAKNGLPLLSRPIAKAMVLTNEEIFSEFIEQMNNWRPRNP